MMALIHLSGYCCKDISTFLFFFYICLYGWPFFRRNIILQWDVLLMMSCCSWNWIFIGDYWPGFEGERSRNLHQDSFVELPEGTISWCNEHSWQTPCMFHMKFKQMTTESGQHDVLRSALKFLSTWKVLPCPLV